MKQKTALQELIEWIEQYTPKNKNTDAIWHKAKSLLPTEMEQIETQSTDFAVWLVKNNYVSMRGNIWVDTNINKGNKTYNINELFKYFTDNFQE